MRTARFPFEAIWDSGEANQVQINRNHAILANHNRVLCKRCSGLELLRFWRQDIHHLVVR
jgi:hypothetical protein